LALKIIDDLVDDSPLAGNDIGGGEMTLELIANYWASFSTAD